MTDPVRLSKYLAQSLPCSRREAELYIEGGWVLVDGEVVDDPRTPVAGQQVSLHPEATLEPLPPVTILLHKPAGSPAAAGERLTPANRSAQDASGIRLIRRHFQRLTACMALADAACGLQVYTQDGRVARKLSEDADLLEQELIVEVGSTLTPELLVRLNQAGKALTRPVQGLKISQQSEQRLRFALKGPAPGFVEEVCQRAGLTVLGIKRLRIGRVAMAGLAVGEWRYLPTGTRF